MRALASFLFIEIARRLHIVQEASKVSIKNGGSSVAFMRQEQQITGTIRPYGNGQWLIRLSAGQDPLTGKRRQPARVVNGSRTDAKRVLLEMQYDLLNGQASASSLSVEQLFEMWINSPTKGGRTRSTSTKYNEQGRFNRYVRPSLGKRQANSLKASDLSLLYDALLTSCRPGQLKPLNPRSVHHVHSMLRAMFNWGWRREYIRENPALRADSPSVKLSPPVAPERHTVASHLDVLWTENKDLWLATWLASTLGLRRSEIAALRWSDIDFNADSIHIRHGVTKTPGSESKMTDTKTGLHGQAVFPMHLLTRSVLEMRHREFRRQLNDIGESAMVDGFILSSEPSHAIPIHPDVLSKAMKIHCRRHAELVPITLQALRKYAASDLAGTGADETTASALLRNGPETARRHYQAANQHQVRHHALGIADRLAEEVA